MSLWRDVLNSMAGRSFGYADLKEDHRLQRQMVGRCLEQIEELTAAKAALVDAASTSAVRILELEAGHRSLRIAVEAELADLGTERDELRWLVRRCWAAWNDATIEDGPGLDLTDEQDALLDATIEWTSLNPRPKEAP